MQSDVTANNGKGSGMNFNPAFVKSALEMSENNPQLSVGEIVDKCEEYVQMEVEELNHCHIEPRSAQYTHCFMSSLNEATNGKFYESFAINAAEATPSKPSTPSESSEPTRASEPSSAVDPTSAGRPSSPIEPSRPSSTIEPSN